MCQLVLQPKEKVGWKKGLVGWSVTILFKDFEGQAASLSSKAAESVAEKSAMSTGLPIKLGYSEKATKFEKIFHLKFDATQ